ncbi:MAG: hypothetical protein ACYDH3_00230 [Candidatus Aminicenantales bacterium]
MPGSIFAKEAEFRAHKKEDWRFAHGMWQNMSAKSTWTMGISFGGGVTGITYAAQNGNYLKIGRLVAIDGYMALANKGSSTGAAKITGLPFMAGGYTACSLWLATVSYANQFMAYFTKNATTITLEEITEAGAKTALNDTNFANNSEVMVGGIFII